MVRYLRVDIEGCNVGCGLTLFSALDPMTEYTDADLEEIGQDLANEQHSWGWEVVEEDEVPENER